jgi:hypothetical protein
MPPPLPLPLTTCNIFLPLPPPHPSPIIPCIHAYIEVSQSKHSRPLQTVLRHRSDSIKQGLPASTFLFIFIITIYYM